MALKFKFKSKDEIPAEQQALYVERDGAWMLDVDGAADKAKLDEFRANNIALSNQLAEQKKRFEGIDPDAGAEAGRGEAAAGGSAAAQGRRGGQGGREPAQDCEDRVGQAVRCGDCVSATR